MHIIGGDTRQEEYEFSFGQWGQGEFSPKKTSSGATGNISEPLCLHSPTEALQCSHASPIPTQAQPVTSWSKSLHFPRLASFMK